MMLFLASISIVQNVGNNERENGLCLAVNATFFSIYSPFDQRGLNASRIYLDVQPYLHGISAAASIEAYYSQVIFSPNKTKDEERS